MTATSWLSFREFNGLIVYYSHLLSYRWAIREVRIGIDNAVPDKLLKLPPLRRERSECDPLDAPTYQKLPPRDAVDVGGADLPPRQRVGDQDVSGFESQQ